MLNVRKIDFEGYGFGSLKNNVDLRGLSLTKIQLEKKSNNPKTNNLDIATYSKIVSLQNDFSVKEIIPNRASILTVCGCTDDTIIYCEETFGKGSQYHKAVYKTTTSHNVYRAERDVYSSKFYDGVFVIEESMENSSNKKVMVFDAKLHLLDSCVIKTSDLNEYEKKRLERERLYKNSINVIRDVYPNLSIIFDFNAIRLKNSNSIISVCYDGKTRKRYLMKFNAVQNLMWKVEVSDNVSNYNVIMLNSNFYLLDYKKSDAVCKLIKFNGSGKILDTYEFVGNDPVITVHNGKPVIVYSKALKQKTLPEMERLLFEGLVVASSMLIVDD